MASRSATPSTSHARHRRQHRTGAWAWSLAVAASLILTPSVAASQGVFPGHDLTGQASVSSSIASWVSSRLSPWIGHSTSPDPQADGTLSFQLDSAIHHSTHDDYLGMSARYNFDNSHPDEVVSLQHQQHREKHTYGGIRTKKQRVRRLKDPKAYLAQREELLAKSRKAEEAREYNATSCGDATSFNALTASLDSLHASPSSWEDVELLVPDVTSRLTLLALARMSSAAYEAPPHPPSWLPTDGFEGWNVSQSFGWVENGIRGHVFSNKANKGNEDKGEEIVVVALKGTSAAILPGGDDTAKRDKLNVSGDGTSDSSVTCSG